MTLVIIVLIFLGFFALAYITKRRFGVLGLGLAAGVLLAQHAGGAVSDFFLINRVPVAPFTPSVLATVALTVLPALFLLFGGPSYSKKLPHIIGSVGFGLLATLLILGPLTTALPTEDAAVKQLLDIIADWQSAIIAGAIAVAVIDTVLLHSKKAASEKAGKGGKH